MAPTDEQWLSVADAFNAAAVDAGGWPEALSRLAAATGSRGGQLIGFGSRTRHFNWLTDPEPDWLDEFDRLGGHDPSINLRMNAGLRAPPLKLLTDPEIATPEERRHSPFYTEILPRFGIPHICATTLLRTDEISVGLAVIRDARQGEIDPVQREMFASLALQARAAIRVRQTLEDQGAQLLAGAMAGLSLAAFVCDQRGIVRAMTPAAEALVSEGGDLDLRSGVLRSRRSLDDGGQLAEAIRRAAAGPSGHGETPLQTFLVRREPALPLVLDVIALPRRQFSFGFEPRALVVARRSDRSPDRALLLQAAYGLTMAEADVALQLSEGRTADAIAADRGVAIGTVRAQIKTILAKLGVSRQIELVALLSRL